MTALAAYWGFAGGDSASEVARLMRAQAGHGPDGSAQASLGTAALGRGLRWTLPEDANDHGPVTLREGKGLVVADVRLDNRAELEGMMLIDPPRARAMSDAAVLAMAIERWGESAVDRILGDYAFIWWDHAEQRLVLARDFLGTRPLFMARGDGFVAAGSALEGGERVPAGHILTVTANAAALRRWWRPAPRALGLLGDDDHAEALHAQLDAAVRRRLRGAGDAVAVLDTGDLAGRAVQDAAARHMPAGKVVSLAPGSDDRLGYDVMLAPRLGALTIGYSGTEYLPPQFARPPLIAAAHLVPGLASKSRQQRIAALSALDLADSMEAGEGPDLRDPTADRWLIEFCLSVPERQWLRGLGRRAFAA